MAKYNLTNKAVEDLSEIWDYTYETWSEKQTDKYYFELIKGCEFITRNSKLARNYDQIDSNIFGYLINRHIIFFTKINKDEILIIRILHSSSDLKNRISE